MTQFERLTPDELQALKAEHVGSNTANNVDYSGPACPRCNDEPWPCRVSRLIRMLDDRD